MRLMQGAFSNAKDINFLMIFPALASIKASSGPIPKIYENGLLIRHKPHAKPD